MKVRCAALPAANEPTTSLAERGVVGKGEKEKEETKQKAASNKQNNECYRWNRDATTVILANNLSWDCQNFGQPY